VPDRPDDLVAALEADLVALAAADLDLERDAEVPERTRIERASIALLDRLRGARRPVELTTLGGGRCVGRVLEVGDGWVLVADGTVGVRTVTAEHVVALGAMLAVRGLGRAVLAQGPRPARSLPSLMRAWCRDRSEVSVRLVDGTIVSGLASATYADHLEISTGAGAPTIVPFAAIATVTR